MSSQEIQNLDEQINKLIGNLRKVNLSIIEKYVSKDLLKKIVVLFLN